MVRNKELPIFSCMLVAIHTVTHEVRRMTEQRPHLYPSHIVNERMDSNTDYLEANELMPKLQSAYRKHHSTETAVLRVLSDILTAIDQQQVTLLALLDLSAAFDCVDHDILLSRLQSTFGLGGVDRKSVV